MQKKIIKKQNVISFKIKRNNNKILSTQEHALSEDAKAFRKIAYKMNVGDSIDIKQNQRHIIFNYLRFRGLSNYFKSRTVSKELNIVAIYCIKKITKSQLL